MKTIYWIETLGNLNLLVVILLVVGIIVLIVSFICYITELSSFNERYDNIDVPKLYKKAIKISAIVVCINLLFVVFIPSKEGLYRIYGIGGTIDYLQSNEKAKQLPDKVVNALDKCLDNLTKDSKNEEETNNKNN